MPTHKASTTSFSDWLDPRHLQILTLTGLLFYGLFGLDIGARINAALLVLVVALATQALGCRIVGIAFDPRSTFITSLSLALLLRSEALWTYGVAAALAIASKFVIRVHGKHLFNPSALALWVLFAFGHFAWVSPGQWGRGALVLGLLGCMAAPILHRSARSDITVAFITAYAALVLGRALWLGDPLVIPLHHLQNGAVLIFAFFMISDPKSTPDSRIGRVLFAAIVALGAFFVHFGLYRQNGFIWALVLASPLVPIIDRLFPATPFQWPSSPWLKQSNITPGVSHA